MFSQRIVYILVLFLSLLNTGFSSCTFDDGSCQRISDPLNEFTISYSDSSLISEQNVELYRDGYRSNKVQLESLSSTTYSQVNPLLDSGSYTFKISATDIFGNSVPEFNEPFLFSNLVSMPPVVPVNIEIDGSTSSVVGKTQFPNQEVRVYRYGNTVEQIATTTSGVDGVFQVPLESLRNAGPKIELLGFESLLNGRPSAQLMRVVYFNFEKTGKFGSLGNLNSVFDNLEVKNPRTVKTGSKYITTSRNFFVGGSATGNHVLVNGVKTPVVGGEFGAFVLLNSYSPATDNEITIEDSSGTTTVTVEYLDINFRFQEIDEFERFVSGPSTQITGSTNIQVPFQVYVNGEFVSEITPDQNNEFNVNIPLDFKKNFVTFLGYDNEEFSTVIYKDESPPQVNLLSSSTISTNSNNVFLEITDDLGISTADTFEIRLGNTGLNYEIVGDVFVLDISSVDPGNYNLVVEGEDLAGNPISFSSQVTFSDTVVSIVDIRESDGRSIFYGDTIYVQGDQQTLSIIPGDIIAFDHIYLDGVEQTDYEINPEGVVSIDLDFQNDVGELELIYMAEDRVPKTTVINYVTDSEDPEIKFDYIKNPKRGLGETIFISGEIIDSNFNWNSFEINDIQPVRIGSFFEVTVTAANKLNIYGSDLSLNTISPPTLSSIIGVENSLPGLTSGDNLFSSAYQGIFSDVGAEEFMTISSFDGINSIDALLPSGNTNFPVPQREGVRGVLFKGKSPGQQEIFEIVPYTIDSTKPYARLFKEGSDYHLIIDGTFSEIPDEEISVSVLGTELAQLSFCAFMISTNSRCIDLGALQSTDSVSYEATDLAGNQNQESFQVSAAENLNVLDVNPDYHVYFEGIQQYAISENWYTQGKIKANSAVLDVKLSDGTQCLFDQISFYCPRNLDPGLNEYQVEVELYSLSGDGDNNDENCAKGECGIEILPSEYNIKINEILGDKVYFLQENYYYRGGTLSVLGELERDAVLKLLVDNEEKRRISGSEGSFLIDLDLTSQLSGVDSREIDLQVQGEDADGNEAFSQKVKLVYNRVLDALITIIIS